MGDRWSGCRRPAAGIRFKTGDRIGIPWLGWAAVLASSAAAARRICARPRASLAIRLDGGYAEFAKADERFCVPIPAGYSDIETALLCAGLIGYPALR